MQKALAAIKNEALLALIGPFVLMGSEPVLCLASRTAMAKGREAMSGHCG